MFGEEAMKESPALADQPQFLEQLKQIPAFQPFSDEILRDILQMTRIRRYASGEYIIKEGHQDSRLFVLVRGQCGRAQGGYGAHQAQAQRRHFRRNGRH